MLSFPFLGYYDAPKDLSSYNFVGKNLINISNLDFGAKDDPDSFIPFYKSKAPILMVVGDDDLICSSIKVVIFPIKSKIIAIFICFANHL